MSLKFLESIADIVPLITLAVLVIKAGVDVLSATSLEKTLENNYQRFVRHLVNIIGIFVSIVIAIFDIYSASRGETNTTNKNLSDKDILIYLVLVGLISVAIIYALCFREYQENYQQKMLVSLMVPKEHYQQYIIKKRIFKDKVLLEPLFSDKENEYLILDFKQVQNHILRQETYDEVKKRRQQKRYEFWNGFNSKRDKIALGVVIVALLIIMAIGTWNQDGVASKIMFLLPFLVFAGNFVRYQRKDYKAGKLEYEVRKGNK
ncbi:hypothetical protein AB996_1649 [Lactococcus cremoris]|uniref:Uncharacterized protein n=1 Tax=Lactococcus lactis subsp. cremoris TaxID=1359 RepID=A0A166J8V5_LACLC|nr:hypothetical protein [Lactococcus cremoris]KZK05768.1 hypothetical protein AB996_1649 [Lactococcus cremoris]